ncbi:hypothetical protein ACHHYP_12008 [Achlya hypogyna]|uniref:Uncharacterized protein n=1 Tax=Achlya hypogyna TaxID=1202772 RepID=A0A1V9YHR4_ACHHY|nr:hypothetical protein ACHHYP_12008 [Achlya hypogyna]
MAPTAATCIFSRILTDQGLMRCIMAYQNGFYMELLPRLVEWQTIATESAAMVFVQSNRFIQYKLPDRYRDLPYFRENLLIFGSYSLFLHPFRRDDRFPLHIAIFEGDLRVVERFVRCKGFAWMTNDAFNLAVRMGHESIIQYFCNEKLAPTTSEAWKQAIALATAYERKAVAALLNTARVNQRQAKRKARCIY